MDKKMKCKYKAKVNNNKNCVVDINESGIIITYTHSNDDITIITYDKLITFSINTKQCMLLLEYENDSINTDTNSELMFIYFNNKNVNIKQIYDLITVNNQKVIKNEFNEPIGDNKLYTINDFI
jgi:hypothetical protein